ncbi:MAG TPA: hypothetical protein VK636_19555 [Gemmatimonadaceae bacterium]|nr:hypothetical protein [Gemmatimonadaceae bacterium]
MTRRTQAQLALLVAGLVVWAYGQRSESPPFQYVGIGCFAVATLLRFARKRDSDSNDTPTS